MWVFKVGGSILHATSLDGSAVGLGHAFANARETLLAGLRRRPERYLLVPGGGRHADAVRVAQRIEGFDDDTAHVRSLAAMDACAVELTDLLGATARVVDRLADVRSTAAAGLTPVWAPLADLSADSILPRTWRLTSDSIAAVAAHRLGLDGVCLLKSCAVPKCASAQELVNAGIVDEEWPQWTRGIASCVLGPEVWAAAGSLWEATRRSHDPP
jgi:aspartokinase-like uncharacterized kinase